MSEKYEAVLVPTTHWDREHSRPFEQFRWHLVCNVMDELLAIMAAESEFKFTFDGQSLPIEDYLDIRPEKEEEIRKYVQEGRLVIGPFFVGPDEFIPSGESIVRNLFYGHKIAKRFGKVMKVGYNPDAFGHISQLPQILRGFGIDNALFSRGVGDGIGKHGTEFRWTSKDGSEVLAVYHHYGNAARFPAEPDAAVDRLRQTLEAMQPKELPYFLLSNGSDGSPPQAHILKTIEYANRKLEGVEITCGTLEDFVDKLRPHISSLPRHEGELRWGKYNLILGGVYSARTYLKQANAKTQTMIEKFSEPFATWAWQVEGEPYPESFLERAWRLLLQNHFHDTICGCSQDKVYHDAMMRYAHSQQISEKLLERSLKVITRNINTDLGQGDDSITLVVFNPLGWKRTEVVNKKIYISLEEGASLKNYIVRDAKGCVISSQILHKKIRESFQPYIWERNFPASKRVLEFDLAFSAEDVPPYGYKVYTLLNGEQTLMNTDLQATHRSIENEFLAVEVNANGTLKVTDKRNGFLYDGLHLFEDVDSVCGEYHHYTTANPQLITSANESARVALMESGPLCATLKIELNLLLPEGVTEDLQSRSDRLVSCPITTYVTLYAGSPRLDFQTVVENNAKDHRLRVLFPTSIKTELVHVEEQFGVVERKIRLPETLSWVEKPVPEGPQQSFVDLSDGERGLAMINQGLAEYAALEERDGVGLALTLVRSVGWIGREGFVTAAYKVPTPDAQCLGRQEFRYSLFPHRGDWMESDVWKEAHSFNVPLEATETNRHQGKLPDSLSFLTIEPSQLIITAIKKAEGEDGIVVRLYNVSSDEVNGRLSCFKPLKSAQLTNLLEESLGNVTVTEGEALFQVGGHKILTLKLCYEG